MKILFNATTNVVGGGMKNAAIFIKYAESAGSDDWTFAVSESVYRLLQEWRVETSRVELFNNSPARCRSSRRELLALVDAVKPDIVYTMAGPAYVDFRCRHVLGLSSPYITHADLQTVALGRSFKGLVETLATTGFKLLHARKADFWVFQTETARRGFCRRAFIDRARTAVVPNAIDAEFCNSFTRQVAEKRSDFLSSEVKIFVPAPPYRHKALTAIPAIASELRSIDLGGRDFRFILTVEADHPLWKEIKADSERLGVQKCVVTGGSYQYSEAAGRYASSDFVFIPSVLETFSVTYLEAFLSERPLIASDRPFVREACGEAALFVDPFNPRKAAQSFAELITRSELQKDLVNKGKQRLSGFINQGERFEKIRSILGSFKD